MKPKALKAAFPYTLPILVGFCFLGITYGIYMNVSGFAFWYPMLMSLTIFAGSMEFITANMLLGAFNPVQAFLMTLMINARHLFYSISMLDKYKGTGWKKFFLIFGMCDDFPAGKPTPKYIQYLGTVLPAAVFGLLIVYCLRNVDVLSGSHGLPELIAIALTVVLHRWKRNMLLSIAGGTICYMVLVQVVF